MIHGKLAGSTPVDAKQPPRLALARLKARGVGILEPYPLVALDVDIKVLVFVLLLAGTFDQVDAGPAEAFGSSHLEYVNCLV